MSAPVRCTCPNQACANYRGPMRREVSPLAPGGPIGESWVCDTCHIERMNPDPAPPPATHGAATRTQTWWLSFCDDDQPEGERFLGVAIVDVDEIDVALAEPMTTALRAAHGLPPLTDARDQWMSGAIGKAYRLKVNPGGAVAAVRVDNLAPPDELAACPRDRLLQRAELEALGVIRKATDGW